MNWRNIIFTNGSNPYICKTDKEFDRIKRKYKLIQISEYSWLASER